MHSDTCSHLRDTYPHTGLDGSVQTIPYCRRCGMEWQAQMKPELWRPVVAIHQKGHPAPLTYSGVMTVAWGWFGWKGIEQLAHTDPSAYALRFFTAMVTLGLLAMMFLSLAAMATHRARCKKFHAAHSVIVAALDAYPVSDEETDAIMGARRG